MGLGQHRFVLAPVPVLEGAPDPLGVGTEAAGRAQAAGFSTIVARPWPTPMHIVARP